MRALVLMLGVLCAPAVSLAEGIGEPTREPGATEPVRYWVAPGDPNVAGAIERGLVRALALRGLSLEKTSAVVEAEPSLQGPLARALAAYAALRFDDAQVELEALSASAQQLGGGDLDTAALGDLYVHLALCAQERGQAEAAWDALARAVRLDPSRTLDPARVPPRTTAAYRRAQVELQRAPAVEVELRLPSGARARIDGDEGHASGPLPRRLVPGPHFVRVDTPGFAPFRGMVSYTAVKEVFAPTLQPLAAPAASRAATTANLDRTSEGWRLAVSAARGGDLRVEARAIVRADNADALSARLLDQVLGPPPPLRTPMWKRWWLWTAVGIGVAAIAIGVPVGVTQRGGPEQGSVGGALGPLR